MTMNVRSLKHVSRDHAKIHACLMTPVEPMLFAVSRPIMPSAHAYQRLKEIPMLDVIHMSALLMRIVQQH
jgi:hypothetical protein